MQLQEQAKHKKEKNVEFPKEDKPKEKEQQEGGIQIPPSKSNYSYMLPGLK